ncbi:MAG: hypothetical protein K9L64_06670 [Candidatus Izimaplasma sp.]|nr:hypothetical protein [Candidatus Izimaplasma bacterium]
MIKALKKNYLFLTLAFLLMVVTSFIFISYAWFTQEENVIFTGEIGFVDVDINVYFEDDVLGQVPAEEVVIDETNNITKPGVYRVNITSSNADYFVEDLRISIDVNSSVNTYFRIKIYEQLTFIYSDISGTTNELSVLYEEGVDLNYDLLDWHDNRTYDNYLYYQNEVKRINETTPLVIGLVDSYFVDQNFETRGPGYSLQLAFSIEAVQSDGGPQNVWGLDTPPWGGSW